MVYYANLGSVFESLGQYDKAKEYLRKALVIATEIDHRKGEAGDYGNLGIIFRIFGDYCWRPSVSGDNGVAPMVSLWWSCSAGCGCRDRSSSGRSCCSCCMRRRCRPRGMGWPLLSGACELSCLPTAPLFSALLS